MQFTLRCSSGQTVQSGARLTDSIGTLMLSVQRETGIHAATQRLVFAGTALTATDTIDKTPLVNGSTIFVLLLGLYFLMKDLSRASKHCLMCDKDGAVIRFRKLSADRFHLFLSVRGAESCTPLFALWLS